MDLYIEWRAYKKVERSSLEVFWFGFGSDARNVQNILFPIYEVWLVWKIYKKPYSKMKVFFNNDKSFLFRQLCGRIYITKEKVLKFLVSLQQLFLTNDTRLF